MFGVCACPGDASDISLAHLKMKNGLFATYTSSSLGLTKIKEKVHPRLILLLAFWSSRAFALVYLELLSFRVLAMAGEAEGWERTREEERVRV